MTLLEELEELEELELVAQRARGGVLFGVLGACYNPNHMIRLARRMLEVLPELEQAERRDIAHQILTPEGGGR